MGQRTQLFVTANTTRDGHSHPRRHRIGRHHQWRYGPHMIICAAQVVDHLEAVTASRYYRPTSEEAEGVAAIYGVNRATAETSGVSLYDDVSTATAEECDNNNGAFLVDLTDQGYTIGFLVGSENGGDLATVTGVDGLMAAFGTDWSQIPEDTKNDEREWAETVATAVTRLRAAVAAGHLMHQDTAEHVSAAELTGVQTQTVWDTIARANPAPATGTRVQTTPA